MQGFPASAAHTGREVLQEMPGAFRIKAKGLPALHVADGWRCQFLEADLKKPGGDVLEYFVEDRSLLLDTCCESMHKYAISIKTGLRS